jgi:TolC family type I secretion outer membrane protein
MKASAVTAFAMNRLVFAAALGVVLAGRAAQAEAPMTLAAVLAQTYTTNPDLLAARQQLAAADEAVAQALGAERPTASTLSSIGPSNIVQTIYGVVLPQQVFGYHQVTGQLNVTQPLFHGGGLDAGVQQAEAQVRAQRAQLQATEASVLLSAATAYADVVLQRQLLVVAQAYEADLQHVAQMLRAQTANRDVTRTALDQTIGRLSTAIAQRQTAEGAVRDAESSFLAVVGQPAAARLAVAPLPPALPSSIDAARAAAAAASPAVLAAIETTAATRAAARQAEAALLPRVDLEGLIQGTKEASAATPTANTYSLLANMTQPIYQGGQLFSAVRAARGTTIVAEHNADTAQRSAIRDAGDAWAVYVSVGDQLAIRRRQVTEDQIAYTAMLRLSMEGQRTVIDTLDTRQELQTVSAQSFQTARDQMVAAYQLLQATGTLTAKVLALKVELFDPETHYHDVRGKLLDPPFQR